MSVSKVEEPVSADLRNFPDLDDLEQICRRLRQDFREMAGSRLLITGGAGFLGYYLVRSVLFYNAHHAKPGETIDLLVYDNFRRGLPDWLEEPRDAPGFRLRDHDVVNRLPKDDPQADYIVHAASIASPTFYRKHPIETMDANVVGLRRLLDHCTDRLNGPSPVRGFLFFSTSEIYGDPEPDSIPTPETYRGSVSCTGPRACYDESKRYGETLCAGFFSQFELPITVVRPFNNYGPGLKITDRRLLPDFARCVLADKDIVMYSDGSPTRTFCYVSDAVVGYYRALVRGNRGEAYNIGNDRPEISIADFADLVVAQARDIFGYRGRVVRQTHRDPDYLVDNPNRRCPQIEKARRDLGFEPEVSLEEGLRRSLLWYRNHPTAEDL